MQPTFPGTTADSLVAGAFLLWTVLTIAGLLRWRQVSPVLVSVLAPSWALFAPYPIVYDFVLAFRSRGGDGRFSRWKLLPWTYTRAWHHALWNPGLGEQVFVFRLCQALAELEGAAPGAERRRARDFLRALVARRIGQEPEAVEFMILRRWPLAGGSEEQVFVSGDEAQANVP
jgi:hypothetical protein